MKKLILYFLVAGVLYSAAWYGASLKMKEIGKKVYHCIIKQSAYSKIFAGRNRSLAEDDISVSGFPFNFHTCFSLKARVPVLNKDINFKVNSITTIPDLIKGNLSFVLSCNTPTKIGNVNIRKEFKYSNFDFSHSKQETIAINILNNFGESIANISGEMKKQRVGKNNVILSNFDAEVDSPLNNVLEMKTLDNNLPIKLKTKGMLAINDACSYEIANYIKHLFEGTKTSANFVKSCSGTSIKGGEIFLNTPDISNLAVKVNAMMDGAKSFYIDLDIKNLDQLIQLFQQGFPKIKIAFIKTLMHKLCKTSLKSSRIRITGDKNGMIKLNGMPLNKLFSLYHQGDKTPNIIV